MQALLLERMGVTSAILWRLFWSAFEFFVLLGNHCF